MQHAEQDAVGVGDDKTGPGERSHLPEHMKEVAHCPILLQHLRKHNHFKFRILPLQRFPEQPEIYGFPVTLPAHQRHLMPGLHENPDHPVAEIHESDEDLQHNLLHTTVSPDPP